MYSVSTMNHVEDHPLLLPTPEHFPAFPYNPPYSIQTDLMKHVYSSIEQRQVTIVESPTGTGKTLSLLCSGLSWLNDEKERARKGEVSQQVMQNAGPAWVLSQAAQIRQRELEAQECEYEERLARARKAEARLRALANARVTKRPRVLVKITKTSEENEDMYLPDRDIDETTDNISPAVRELMAKFSNTISSHECVDTHEPICTKIYYASRTHSQLTQVIPELQKLKFKHISFNEIPSHSRSRGACSVPLSSGQRRQWSAEVDGEGPSEIDRRQWRTVALGSRKQLCINEDIASKPGDLDEKCRDLQDGHKGRRCPYLPLPEDQVRLLDLRDQILASPKDIEDLAIAGKNAQTCPYYGSRGAIPQAELVTLPYNLLLQKSAREALGIDLSNQIVVIDEAHNLIPTLLSLSSVRITSYILSTSLNQVTTYYEKFRTRLSALHGLHLKRLISYMQAIQKMMEDWKVTKTKSGLDARTEILTIPSFIEKLGRKAVGINLLEIETYLKRSKIARKISGYAEAVSSQDRGRLLTHHLLVHLCSGILDSVSKWRAGQGTPPLHAVEALMVGLVGAREDGRIILSLVGDNSQHPEELEIKYQLLNPSVTFREVVESARSVILAGGTMSPMSDVITQLFAWLPSNRLSTFSCGHVIPRSHVQTLCVPMGPTGSLLEFKYAQQTDQRLLTELGQVIFTLCSLVPRGMVVFFPSYSSLEHAQKAWNTTQHMVKFGTKKMVFFEPQTSSGVESTLREYANAVRTLSSDKSDKRTGGMLFAVVGGKLSEGLNFSDELARAVVVVGLPFANKNSPELQERMRYVNEIEKRNGSRHTGARDAGSQLYENLCMSAVNQSIGRAIRHRMDWASLILIDQRYSLAGIQNKLPAWIRDGIVVCDGFGQTVKHLSQFYRERKQGGTGLQ